MITAKRVNRLMPEWHPKPSQRATDLTDIKKSIEKIIIEAAEKNLHYVSIIVAPEVDAEELCFSLSKYGYHTGYTWENRHLGIWW